MSSKKWDGAPALPTVITAIWPEGETDDKEYRFYSKLNTELKNFVGVTANDNGNWVCFNSIFCVDYFCEGCFSCYSASLEAMAVSMVPS